MKYAICNEVYGDWPFDRVCKHAAAAGYSGIEFAPFTLGSDIRRIDESRRRELRDIAGQNGLQTVGLHWLLAGTKGLHLTSGNAGVRQRTADYLAELTSLCRDLGGSVMVLGSPDERSLQEGMSVEQGTENAILILNQLAPVLKEYQVTLALEPLGPEETDFMLTAQQAIEIIKEIRSENIRLHLDVKAMSTEVDSFAEIIDYSAEWLVHFHANDPNRQGPGMGDIDFKPILRTLKQIDYDGWISVEVFDYSPGVDALVKGSIDYLKRIEKSLFQCG